MKNNYQTSLSLNEKETKQFEYIKGEDSRFTIKKIFTVGMSVIAGQLQKGSTKHLEKHM